MKLISLLSTVLTLSLAVSTANAGPRDLLRSAKKSLAFQCQNLLARAESTFWPLAGRMRVGNYNQSVLRIDALARARETQVETPELKFRKDPSFALNLANPLHVVTLYREQALFEATTGALSDLPAGTHLFLNDQGLATVVDQKAKTAVELNKHILDSNKLDQKISSVNQAKIDELFQWYGMPAVYASSDLRLYTIQGELVKVGAGNYVVIYGGLFVDAVSPDEDYNLRAVFIRRMMSGQLSQLKKFMQDSGIPFVRVSPGSSPGE